MAIYVVICFGSAFKQEAWILNCLKPVVELNALYTIITLFRYSKTLKSGSMFWRCSVRSCKSSIKIDAESTFLIELKDEHSHESDKAGQRQQKANKTTVEFQWLEHLWNHENMFETDVVRPNECQS